MSRHRNEGGACAAVAALLAVIKGLFIVALVVLLIYWLYLFCRLVFFNLKQRSRGWRPYTGTGIGLRNGPQSR